MPAFPLSFSSLAGALERMNGVDAARSTAFRARIKHLQRLQFPPGVNTGKGRPAEYGVEQCTLLAISIELLQLGLTPERATGLLVSTLPAVVREIQVVCVGDNILTVWRQPAFMYLDPEALVEFTARGKQKKNTPPQQITFGAGFDLSTFWKRRPKSAPRLAVIDVSRVILNLINGVAAEIGATDSDLAKEMWAWGKAEWRQ